MAGRLELEYLAEQVEHGEVDTVVAAFTDMQGRLVGKRVTGRYFLERSWHEMARLRLSADRRHGDGAGARLQGRVLGQGLRRFRDPARPRARCAASPGCPARRWCWATSSTTTATSVPHSPRAILKRQLARLAELGFTAKMASELEFYVFDDSYAAAREKNYRDLKTAGWYIEDYHIFETTKREPLMRAIRNGMDAAGIPVAGEQGRVGTGPGGAQPRLRRGARDGGPARHLQERRQGDRLPAGQGGELHGEVAHGPRRQLAATSTLSLWDADDRPAFVDGHGESELFRQFLAGQLALGPRA